MQLNSSSYYRANPYSDQGYLPDSAYRNRKPAQFASQLPQGQSFFEPTGKKHYKHLSYQSEIAHDHVIGHQDDSPQELPAKNRDYFRSLNTLDIEGASTNTLISQSIKNKIKAQQELAKKSRVVRQAKYTLPVADRLRMEDEQIRNEAIEKLRQHRVNHPVPARPDFQVEPRSRQYYDQAQNIYLAEQQKQLLKQQQAQLNYHQAKRTKTEDSRIRVEREQQTDKQRNNYLEKQLIQERQRQQSESKKSQPQHNNIPQGNQPQYQLSYQPAPSSRLTPVQKFDPSHQQTALQKIQAEYRRRQEPAHQLLSQPQLPQAQSHPQPHPQSHPQPYTQKQRIEYIPDAANNSKSREQVYNQRRGRKQGVGSGDYESQRLMDRGSPGLRQMHRRFNPTFLSFGSPTIGLAGRNIVGI